MADQFVAEIRIFSCNFAPKGWATCDGQLMSISQNTALFSLCGTMYGGDGKSTFGLPNLQGAAPMFWGQAAGGSLFDQGQMGGEQFVTLLNSEMPVHTHNLQGGDVADDNDPDAKLPGGGVSSYTPPAPNTQMNLQSLAP